VQRTRIPNIKNRLADLIGSGDELPDEAVATSGRIMKNTRGSAEKGVVYNFGADPEDAGAESEADMLAMDDAPVPDEGAPSAEPTSLEQMAEDAVAEIDTAPDTSALRRIAGKRVRDAYSAHEYVMSPLGDSIRVFNPDGRVVTVTQKSDPKAFGAIADMIMSGKTRPTAAFPQQAVAKSEPTPDQARASNRLNAARTAIATPSPAPASAPKAPAPYQSPGSPDEWRTGWSDGPRTSPSPTPMYTWDEIQARAATRGQTSSGDSLLDLPDEHLTPLEEVARASAERAASTEPDAEEKFQSVVRYAMDMGVTPAQIMAATQNLTRPPREEQTTAREKRLNAARAAISKGR